MNPEEEVEPRSEEEKIFEHAHDMHRGVISSHVRWIANDTDAKLLSIFITSPIAEVDSLY